MLCVCACACLMKFVCELEITTMTIVIAYFSMLLQNSYFWMIFTLCRLPCPSMVQYPYLFSIKSSKNPHFLQICAVGMQKCPFFIHFIFLYSSHFIVPLTFYHTISIHICGFHLIISTYLFLVL